MPNLVESSDGRWLLITNPTIFTLNSGPIHSTSTSLIDSTFNVLNKYCCTADKSVSNK
jgi:hypothetical protein